MAVGTMLWFLILRDWSNLLLALILCLPVSGLTFLLGSMLTGTIRQLLPDWFATCASIFGGLALAAWGSSALRRHQAACS